MYSAFALMVASPDSVWTSRQKRKHNGTKKFLESQQKSAFGNEWDIFNDFKVSNIEMWNLEQISTSKPILPQSCVVKESFAKTSEERISFLHILKSQQIVVKRFWDSKIVYMNCIAMQWQDLWKNVSKILIDDSDIF